MQGGGDEQHKNNNVECVVRRAGVEGARPTTYAIVTIAVMDSAAPAMYAAELRRQFSLVARKIALRICGPAIITNAIGRTFAMFTINLLPR